MSIVSIVSISQCELELIMDEKELKEVFDLYTAFWKQFKAWKDIELTDNEAWAQLREDDEQIVNACSNEQLKTFAVGLGVATESLIEAVARRKYGRE